MKKHDASLFVELAEHAKFKALSSVKKGSAVRNIYAAKMNFEE